MNDYLKERDRERKREYHREWRAKHPESVKAAQMRYWTKKAAEMRQTVMETESRAAAAADPDGHLPGLDGN